MNKPPLQKRRMPYAEPQEPKLDAGGLFDVNNEVYIRLDEQRQKREAQLARDRANEAVAEFEKLKRGLRDGVLEAPGDEGGAANREGEVEPETRFSNPFAAYDDNEAQVKRQRPPPPSFSRIDRKGRF